MDKKIIPVAVGALVKDRKILLIKKVKPPYQGLWNLHGGKIDHGKHIEDAITREILEESGLKVKMDKMLGIVSEHLLEKGAINTHLLLFVCNLKAEKWNHSEKEEGELQWFDLNTIDENKEKILLSDFLMIKKWLWPIRAAILQA